MARSRIFRYGGFIEINGSLMKNFLSVIQNHRLNIPGKSIPRKIVVFESDDWGSIRIPSYKGYINLKSKGINLDGNPYNRFDSLESGEDLLALYDVISSFRDSKGNHPILTANFIVANPDFEKISDANFEKYYYEYFTETYKRNRLTESSWATVNEGVRARFIKPQFHGREHVNALQWLKLLKSGDRQFLNAFQERVFSIDLETRKNKKRDNLMATLDYNSIDEQEFAYNQLIEGTEIFEQIFGSSSDSFIAPCNVWDAISEEVLFGRGIKFIQGFRGQKIPNINLDSYRSEILYSGQTSSYGQIYLVRNAYFEPSTLANYDWIGNCLRKIHAAFFWNKPAIISMHRLNLMGSIFQENRTENLLLLKKLLNKIIQRWPEVEFLSSDQLGHLYTKTQCVE
jgi:hypothetical protein